MILVESTSSGRLLVMSLLRDKFYDDRRNWSDVKDWESWKYNPAVRKEYDSVLHYFRMYDSYSLRHRAWVIKYESKLNQGICYKLNSLQDVAGPPPYPILEYAEYGNLRAFLRHQRNIGSVIQKVEMICISMKFIVEKAIEIAAGMNYLAEQSVVHGDLAARNVLGPFLFS